MEQKTMFKEYVNPLTSRYSSRDMSYIFSPHNTYTIWRQLWYSLASTQHSLGLTQITPLMLTSLKNNIEISHKEIIAAKVVEKRIRHDVMSHIEVYGESAEIAKGIIHLGATSCYVKDNTYLVQMKSGMEILKGKIVEVIRGFRKFVMKNKAIGCLGFTHLQPAQMVTVGKRGCLWAQDFVFDLEEVERRMELLLNSFRGAKGTTGTQASFMKLFNNDEKKVKMLDEKVTVSMGFKKPIMLTGQTYTRKLDYLILSTLSSIAQSANKFAVDIRLLMHMNEVEEPFKSTQVGSSAMAYKRNPMRCERICGLSRYVISLLSNAANTHANQWFERSLDDSANRRLTISQAFLSVDGILKLVNNVIDGLTVFPLIINKNVQKQLPFMATENIIMNAVKKGGDRQKVHERIRELSFETSKEMKLNGKENNDLIEKLKKDKMFKNIEFDSIMKSENYIGRCVKQVEEFVNEKIDPILKKYGTKTKKHEELNL